MQQVQQAIWLGSNYSQIYQVYGVTQENKIIVPLSRLSSQALTDYFDRHVHLQANFIESADRFLLPRNGTESFVDDTVRSLYMHWNKRAVVAFMPHLRVFEVSQEMGIPVTLLTNASINTAMKDIGISRKVYTPDLQLVNER